MSKDISAAKEGIQTSKFRSRGIQVHPVNEEREQNLLNSRNLEPPKFIRNTECTHILFFGHRLRGVVSLKPSSWLG